MDFPGHFRVAYSPDFKALYVGLEVSDESFVIDPSRTSAWDSQDGGEVYLRIRHVGRWHVRRRYASASG